VGEKRHKKKFTGRNKSELNSYDHKAKKESEIYETKKKHTSSPQVSHEGKTKGGGAQKKDSRGDTE